MKTFVKNYIGKGTQVNGLKIVKVTLKMEDVMKHVYEKEGKQYLTFELAELKETDKFERTHTCYVSTLSDVPGNTSSANKAPGKKRTAKK